MFGKGKEKEDDLVLLKELVKLSQKIDEVSKSIWHLEKRVESIQAKLNINFKH